MRTSAITFPVVIGILLSHTVWSVAREPNAEERAALSQLMEECNRWTLTGLPENFIERFDLEAREEERKLLIELATLDVDRSWARIWNERGIKDAASVLPKLPREEFWRLYHKKTGFTNADNPSFHADKVAIRVFTISIEMDVAANRELAYVIYARLHDGFKPTKERLLIFQCSKTSAGWKPWTHPDTVDGYRAAVDRARTMHAMKANAGKPSPQTTESRQQSLRFSFRGLWYNPAAGCDIINYHLFTYTEEHPERVKYAGAEEVAAVEGFDEYLASKAPLFAADNEGKMFHLPLANGRIATPWGDEIVFLIDRNSDGYLSAFGERRSVNGYEDPWKMEGVKYKKAVGITLRKKPDFFEEGATLIIPLNDNEYTRLKDAVLR